MAYILAINPGSTFTKTLRHSSEEISQYERVIDQLEFREKTILAALEENGVKLSDIAVIVGRGGLLRPISSGVYEVNEAMTADLASACYGEHASNLGGILAKRIAASIEGCRAFIADPVVVDELTDIARVSGHPLFPKISIFHALNHKAIASGGRVVDVNNALFGEGPFSPERTGGLSAMQVADACFSGKYTHAEIKKMISGKGGIVAHLGTNSFKEVEDRVAAGDAKAKLISDAFAYNVAKAIGGMAAALSGKVDAILLTGGIAYGKELMQQIADMVSFIAPVKVYPGEDEMGALAGNALAVLEGREEVRKY